MVRHGFGGNADQFRYNLPALALKGYHTYATDFLGYGYSDKPNPREYEVNYVYNFDTWASQTLQFIETVVKRPCVLVCNSVGGIAGLECALRRPDLITGVVPINVSLRLLHVKKQSPWQRPLVAGLQTLLRTSGLGEAFFRSVATPVTLRRILAEAYAMPPADLPAEVVDLVLAPGLAPGAAAVFLDFISYRCPSVPPSSYLLLVALSCCYHYY